tara:strand:+ start:6065 stop:6331 length:267 start_codon:yes stop_codon:yes gene_type:complete
MWTNKYKEDALKWRKQEESKVYKLPLYVYIVGVETPKTVFRHSSYRQGLEDSKVYTNFRDQGIVVDDIYYPSHRINRIEFGEIEEAYS